MSAKHPQISITARDLRDLLAPVLPLADKNAMYPILNAVHLETDGAYLTATATDRYRLGITRHKTDQKPPKGLSILIPLTAAKQLLALFKPTRANNADLVLTFKPDGLAVRGQGLLDGSQFDTTWPLVAGDYPPVRSLFHKRPPAKQAHPLALNPGFLGDFRHAQREGEPIILVPTGPNHSVLVIIGDHFRGLIQPMRYAADIAADIFADGWDALLPRTHDRRASRMSTNVEPSYCHCGHVHEDHTNWASEPACGLCDCNGFVEHAAVIATLDSLNIDDQLNEDRRRDNLPAALHIERTHARRRPA